MNYRIVGGEVGTIRLHFEVLDVAISLASDVHNVAVRIVERHKNTCTLIHIETLGGRAERGGWDGGD